MTYFQKHAGILDYFGKALQLAGQHPKATLGALGGLVLLSQLPRLANTGIGLYVMGSEHRKKNIMRGQTSLLQQLALNTQPIRTGIDSRRIPIKEPLA